jgi:hypothetical protein
MQDGADIDFNRGDNSIFNANAFNNTILTLGGTSSDGDGATFDVRGNARAIIPINGISINDASGEAIDSTFTNTTTNNSPGTASAFIPGNVFSGSTAGLLSIGLINNPGTPVSEFYVTGGGNHASQVGNTTATQSLFNNGPLPKLDLNDILQP